LSDVVHDPLLERVLELEELGRVATDVLAGRGSVRVVVGPVGIGKSALLDAAGRRAEQQEIRVLRARASELDRAYVFGVVHQLFEASVIARSSDELFSGAAENTRLAWLYGKLGIKSRAQLGDALAVAI
jgi:predicted ATPase